MRSGKIISEQLRSYDPDVFLPTPFDAFVLSGHCPKIQWPQHEHSRKATRLAGLGEVLGV
jgi:hypothetical protein